MTRAASPGDLTGKPWTEAESLIPAAESRGREREVNMRAVLKRPDLNAQKKAGFVLLPRCWVAERTFAWLDNYRRLSKDDE